MPLLLLRPAHLNRACSEKSWSFLQKVVAHLPLDGTAPVTISFEPFLSAARGKLLVGTEHGTPVHAATFLRSRRVVLEAPLLADRRLLRFILVHELFHFVWPRLGNRKRAEFTALLLAEAEAHACGEIGVSSEGAKAHWQRRPASPALWKHYVCESFCDTAAALSCPKFDSGSLNPRWLLRRRKWFQLANPRSGWRV